MPDTGIRKVGTMDSSAKSPQIRLINTIKQANYLGIKMNKNEPVVESMIRKAVTKRVAIIETIKGNNNRRKNMQTTRIEDLTEDDQFRNHLRNLIQNKNDYDHIFELGYIFRRILVRSRFLSTPEFYNKKRSQETHNKLLSFITDAGNYKLEKKQDYLDLFTILADFIAYSTIFVNTFEN
jgi:hypothetical protein